MIQRILSARHVRPQRWRAFVAAATALVLTSALASPALASTVNPVNTTFDRPAIVAVAGEYNIAWAGTDANGKVNVATIDSGGNVLQKWTDSSSATFQGTGVALTIDQAFAHFFDVIAWTDLGTTVHVALSGNNFSLACESTGFGSSVDTPYLTVAADGTLYLTTVTSNGAMHVTEVDNSCVHSNGQIGGSFTAGPSTTVAGNTSFDGPTLLDLNSNVGFTPNLWLVWAGTNSAHSINIAKFTPGNPNLGTKFVENKSTIADMGSTTDSAGRGFFTYCGTNHAVFGQHFDGNGPESELPLQGSCAIFTNSNGFINGGVDVTFNGSAFAYIFPNNSNNDLVVNTF
jgi:hypothetical protein